MAMNPRANDPAQAKEYFAHKMTFTTGPVELDAMLKQGEDINVIDVRAAEDYAKGHIQRSINLPKDKWNDLQGLSKDKTNVVLCYSQVCHLAAKAALEFASKGYPVMELEGGMASWRDHKLPLVT